ncbi:hypothetical protein [Pseudomonas simiae]|uniref:hypothetical protein n=1 Tax=Pseudomonas simiae TaxID=321846 RepID=UPI003F73CC55
MQLADLQRRQRLAVEFTVGVERQAVEPEPVQRHHVFRQFGAQALLDAVQAFAWVQCFIRRHQVADQVLAIHAFLHAHRRIAHFRLFVQARFDFTQFDAVAANLHLVVDTSDVLQHAVTATAREVAGAVESFARCAEGVWHKYGRGAQRVADVTAADTRAGHAQLTHRALRHQFQCAIQQVQTVVVGGRTNRQIGASGRRQVDTIERHIVRTLRRAVSVDQPNLRITLQPLVRQFRWHRFAGRQHPAQAIQADAVLCKHALDQRRHAFQHGDALGLDMFQQALGIMRDGVRHDVHPRAEQRRSEELPYGNIKALRRGLRNHIRVAQGQVRHFAQLVIEHAALFHHHALGQTGGTGGIDHVGKVIRSAVDTGVFTTRGYFLPHQKLAVKTVQQLDGLLTGCFGAHQQWRAAQVEDAAQALARQAWVQRQVAGTGLEAADDHAEQVEVTLGQQRHRLIQADTRCHQRVAQAVAATVQFVIGPLLVEATGGDALRMSGDLLFEQLDVAALQRVVVLALVATFHQELTLLLANQRQVGHVTLEALDQRQQQALELAEHALHGGFVEVALVVGQVQPQVITWIAHGGQREVGVGAAGIRGGVQALCTVQHRDFHRGVFEHEQAVEQRLALGQFAVFLDRHQWQVLVLAQLHIAVEQIAQPLAHAARLTVLGQFHPQGDTVDEQADGALHLGHFHRAPGHGDTEQHVAIAAQTAQHQRPRRLGEGVDGQLVSLCQFAQLCTVAGIETGVAIAHHHAAAVVRVFTQERPVARDWRGALEALQVLLPPLACLIEVLALQPGNVVSVARRRGQLRVAAFTEGHVELEEVIHQQ